MRIARMTKLASSTLVMALLAGCAHLAEPSPGKKLLEGDITKLLTGDTEITLQRSGCYGGCAPYTVKVTGNGEVDFQGTGQDRREQTYHNHIDQEKVVALLTAFRDIDYFDGEKPACLEFVLDSGSANTSIKIGAIRKDFHDYHGCADSPSRKQLVQLEMKIDAIIGTQVWVGSLYSAHEYPRPPEIVPPVPLPRIPALRSMYFDTNSTVIKDEFKPLLQTVAKEYYGHRISKIYVAGNTDWRGGPVYNLKLGQKRADAVRDYLISLGVQSTDIEAYSQGEVKPMAVGRDENSMAENRRVDIQVIQTWKAEPPVKSENLPL